MKYAFKLMVLLFVSLPFLLVISVMRNFYLIRFDSLVSDRIGHFSGNIELYCCERDAGINVPDTAYVDLFFHSGKPCNKQLDIMWRREIIIVPGLIGVVLSLTLRVINIINNMFPGVNKHVISGAARSDRDIHNLLDETPQHLKFTQKEQLRGEEWLSANGITTNSKIVLLMVRDSTYLKHKYPDKDWSYHDYRDSSINNFVKVSSALASRGYYVIRMGQHVDEKLLPDSIDILLLGIGEDGHIASLFPYSPELNEQTRLCLPITGPKPPYRRVTVTPPVIKHSKLTYILAPSRTKSIIIEKVKQSIEDSNRFPAKLVKKPIWCCD